LIGIGGHVAAGFLALDQLDEPGTVAALEHLGDGSTPVELWPFVAFFDAPHALHFGDPRIALASLEAAEQAHDPALSDNGAAAVLLARSRADLFIAIGQGQRAQQLLLSQPAASPVLAVPAARIQLLAGDHAAARNVAARWLWDPALSTRERLDLLLVISTAAVRMGEPEAAVPLVRQALIVYRKTGLLRPFATVPAGDLKELFRLAGSELESRDAAKIEGRPPVYPGRIALIDLTRRERSVLAALADTASRQEIADELYVSLSTVKSQLGSLYRKLGTTTREDTLLAAHQLGVLP
jgi:LuxR family maltose regulon positive regulatory protein